MWSIVNKYLYPVHKNKLSLRDLFFLYSFSIPWVVFKQSYRFYFSDVLQCVKITEFCSQKE